MVVEITSEELDGGGPKWGGAGLVALAGDGDESVREVEPRDLGAGGFLGARTCVVKEEEDGEIADAVGGVEVDLGENGLKLMAGEEFGEILVGSFSGDIEDPSGEGLEGGLEEAKVSEEGLDGGEAKVAGEGAVGSPGVFVFKILKESEEGFDLKVFNGERARGAVACGEETEEEAEGVGIGFEGERANAAVLAEIGEEERFKMSGQVGFHEGSLGRSGICFLAVSSARAWKRLSPSRRRSLVMVR